MIHALDDIFIWISFVASVATFVIMVVLLNYTIKTKNIALAHMEIALKTDEFMKRMAPVEYANIDLSEPGSKELKPGRYSYDPDEHEMVRAGDDG